MKSLRRAKFIAAAALVTGIAARAELARWVQDLASPSRLQAVFFHSVPLPAGPVEIRRPPSETRAELAKLIAATPTAADLYTLRAREDEQQLDFAAAESDWKKYAQLASDKSAATLALADFYHRRLHPSDEIAALESVARAPSPASEKFTPPAQQQAWRAFERIEALIAAQALPPDLAVAQYRAWIARYPAEPSLYNRLLAFLEDHQQWAGAEKAVADYRAAFPADTVFPLDASASLALKRGSLDQALRVYDRGFRPLWPPELIHAYFELLKQTHSLRRYLAEARARIAQDPTDLAAAARIYYYFEQQGDLVHATRALAEYRRRKQARPSPWTADELATLAQLSEGAHAYDQAARDYYGLYSLASATGADREKALAGLANLLLSAPEQPIAFGSGNLSLYRDIGAADPGPGFFNGILSLILNGASPRTEYATEDQASLAYFHRARAAELIALFDSRFPNSTERPILHARLIAAYAVYGENDAVIRAGRAFLTAFPTAAERATVALAMADAYARRDDTEQEFALYDDLLKEFAARAEGMPLGAIHAPPPPAPPEETTTPAAENPTVNANDKAPAARSPEYARILDRYISRLVALQSIAGALALYRHEIDRNPADPGLYERLAAFLDQNKMGAELEQVYRRAMAQFPDRGWSHKLARWYLRHQQAAQFDRLTRDVVAIFSGADLEAYLRESTRGQPLAPALYRQVNLYAHQRFPRDLTFVRNLLTAYVRKGTANPAARETLLRSYWFYSDDLRDSFFEFLSRAGKLSTELAALRQANALANANPAAAQFLAEGEAWQSHFEKSAPLFRSLAQQYPGEPAFNARAATLYRSLATYDAPGDLRNTAAAVSLEDNLARFDPRDSAVLTRIGEIYADRDLYNRARPFWNRIAAIEPGSSSGYLEAATIFWDYFRFDDALRLIDEGRRKLGNPALYAYEAGAIHENRREYARALEEYAKVALTGGDSPARSRLLELAQRPQFRARLDELTTPPASSPGATVPALALRAGVLLAENRRDDLRQLLTAAANRASAPDVLEYIDSTAAAHGFADAQERAKLRKAAITTDPVERMQAQLALAKFYEGRNDLNRAARAIDDLYKSNPAVLGVVRATVDFYSRTHQTKRAVDVLTESARRAQPAYRDPFTLEAALKASDSGDFKTSRALLTELLARTPFEPRYLAAMADTYARQSDDRGLRDFYTGRLQALRESTLTAPEKIERAATLRRGLVPVLTRLKDYPGAVDQYVELINRYPDDEDLAREAAAYAADHGRAPQLTAYYDKTSRDSPRDYRWPMVQARIATQLEDFPAALAAYARAIQIRPDRVDLYTASAALSERLRRFEEAAAAYAQLYELNYHNSQWMEKLAAVRARQGQAAAAIQALRTAFLERHTPSAEDYFTIALRLESWNLLAQARDFAQQGVQAAGPEALTRFWSGAAVYARLMTRVRQHPVAYRTLLDLARGQDPAAVQQGLDAALHEMGAAVNLYFTPEEKSAFAKFLAGDTTATLNRERALLVAVQAAGLTDLEAAWRANLLIAGQDASQAQPLIELQKRRLRLDELGGQLEAYWKALPPDTENRDTWLDQSAMYFRQAGSYNSELRVLGLKANQSSLTGPNLERYAQLLFERAPQRVEAVASSDLSDEVRNALATAALRRAAFARALSVVVARGRGLPPVWTRAYTGLTGLYFASPAPQVNTAFLEALGSSATIGERLGKPVNRERQLAGDVWFYYGSRYGEYLAAIHQGDPEDYLPAMLENSPGHADAYLALGEYYRDAQDLVRADQQYRAALQLDPARAEAHDQLAAVLWTRNQHDDAVKEWRAALDALSRRQDTRRVPETFWPGLESTLRDLGRHHALALLRPEADRILRTYIRRNGSYRIDTLLEAAIEATGDPAAGVAWILDLAKSAPDSAAFLGFLSNQDWVPADQKPVVLRAAIDAWRASLGAPEGESSYREMAESELTRARIELARWLLNARRPSQAQAVLTEISEPSYKTHEREIVLLEVRAAAQSGGLRTLLDRYAARGAKAPSFDMLRDAANELRLEAGGDASSSTVLEFLYTRQLAERDLTPSTFLGLAEIRLARNDAAGALALLRRLNLIAGEPFENLTASAELLMRAGHPSEALEFLKQRVQAVPWDTPARVALGRALLAANNEHDQAIAGLKAAALSGEAPSAARAAAATALGDAKAGPLSEPGTELNWLSTASALGAEKPYFYFARLRAASQASDPAVKFRLLQAALAINPEPAKPRLDLLRAALEAKRYNTAISASDFTPHSGSYPEAHQAEVFLASTDPPLGRSERAALARALAAAYEKIGQPPEALTLLHIAERLDPANPETARQVARLNADLERERANAQRRPAISPNLEQDHLVRPRLVAAGGPQ